MEWWIVAALAVVLLVQIKVYRLALAENRALTNYVLLMLLDGKVQGVQRASLVEFVHATDAKNAGDLGIKVRLATESLATKLYGNTLLGVNGMLWKLKQGLAAA
jgi:hypothetical protein